MFSEEQEGVWMHVVVCQCRSSVVVYLCYVFSSGCEWGRVRQRVVHQRRLVLSEWTAESQPDSWLWWTDFAHATVLGERLQLGSNARVY